MRETYALAASGRNGLILTSAFYSKLSGVELSAFRSSHITTHLPSVEEILNSHGA